MKRHIARACQRRCAEFSRIRAYDCASSAGVVYNVMTGALGRCRARRTRCTHELGEPHEKSCSSCRSSPLVAALRREANRVGDQHLYITMTEGPGDKESLVAQQPRLVE